MKQDVRFRAIEELAHTFNAARRIRHSAVNSIAMASSLTHSVSASDPLHVRCSRNGRFSNAVFGRPLST